MNREILFKAKIKDNGKWVEGYYCKLDETTYCISEDYERHPVPTHHYILHETMTDWGLPNRFLQFEIDPSTICQCTGLTDKNGKKIWENDIVKRTDLHVVSEPSVGFIEYDLENTSFLIHWMDKVEYSPTYHWKDRLEVIGNIFDNSDLLGVE